MDSALALRAPRNNGWSYNDGWSYQVRNLIP